MADEIARLTIEVKSDSVKQATAGLADLSKQADATAQSAGRLNKSSSEVEKAQRGAADAMRDAIGIGTQAAATTTRGAQAARQLTAATTATGAALGQEANAFRTVLQAAASTTTATERLRATTAGATTAATRHAAAMRDQAKAAQDAGTQSGRFSAALGRVQGIAGPLGITLGAAFAVQTISRAVTGALQLADGFAQVGQRVRLFGSSAENARDVQRQLVALAVQNRAPLEDVAGIYTRISAVSEDLNASQQQVLTVTKAVAQTFTLSGASAAQAAASGQQLAQALGSGTLAGDELKSIMENNLVLAQAIAKGFGVSVGELKKMGAEGKLTSQGVFKALLSQADELAAKAGTVGPNLNSGIQTFNTGLQAALGSLDSALGLTKAIGGIFDGIGRGLAAISNFELPEGVRKAVAGINRSIRGGNQLVDGNIVEAFRTFTTQDPGERLSRGELADYERAVRDQPNNPLFKAPGAGGLNPLQSLAAFPAAGVDINKASVGELRRKLGLEFEFGSGESAAGKDDLRKLYEDRARDAKKAADDSEAAQLKAQKKMLEALAAQGKQITDGIVSREFNGSVALREAAKKGGTLLPFFSDGSISEKESLRESKEGLTQSAREMEKGSEDAKAVFQSLVNGLQSTFANGLQGLFTKGLSSVNDFARSIKDTILRAFSDILASAITKRLLSALAGLQGGGSGTLAATSGGGLLGSLAQFGAVKAGGSLLGLLGIGGAAAGAGKLANVAGAGIKAGGVAPAAGFSFGGALASGGAGFLLGNAIGQRNGKTAGALGGAAGGAATGALIGSIVPGLGTVVGGVIGGVAGALGGLFGGSSKKKKQQEAARKLAEDSAAFADELIARNLEASGDSLGAQKKRLLQQQKAELDAIAARFGKGSRQVFDLMAVQKKELDALSAGDSALASGTYLAPSGFSANSYRFSAGRPATMPTAQPAPITITGDVRFELPPGSPRDQAQQVVRELQSMANAQGLPATDWNRVDVQ